LADAGAEGFSSELELPATTEDFSADPELLTAAEDFSGDRRGQAGAEGFSPEDGDGAFAVGSWVGGCFSGGLAVGLVLAGFSGPGGDFSEGGGSGWGLGCSSANGSAPPVGADPSKSTQEKLAVRQRRGTGAGTGPLSVKSGSRLVLVWAVGTGAGIGPLGVKRVEDPSGSGAEAPSAKGSAGCWAGGFGSAGGLGDSAGEGFSPGGADGSEPGFSGAWADGGFSWLVWGEGSGWSAKGSATGFFSDAGGGSVFGAS
jgi:hypothetical protein